MTGASGGPETPGLTIKRSGTRKRSPATIVAWVLQILLALAMVGAGAAKLSGQPAMIQLFEDIGAGQWLRFMVGALEVAGGIGLLVPRLRVWAALGLLLLLVGATLTNLVVLQINTAASVLYAVAALAILLLRRHELRRPWR